MGLTWPRSRSCQGVPPTVRRTTYKEAIANVEVVIDEWIETARELGRPIPEPKVRRARRVAALWRTSFGSSNLAITSPVARKR